MCGYDRINGFQPNAPTLKWSDVCGYLRFKLKQIYSRTFYLRLVFGFVYPFFFSIHQLVDV